MADTNDRFSPGLFPGSSYGSKNPSVKKSLLYRYNQSTGSQQQLDSDVPSPSPSFISDCPDLSSPETIISLSSLRSPDAFPQVKSAESCDTTVSSESAQESLGSDANGPSSIASPIVQSRTVKRPQAKRHKQLSDTMLESKETYADLAHISHVSQNSAFNSRELKRGSFNRPDVHNKELFTSHWAERVAAHHRDYSSTGAAQRMHENTLTKDNRSGSFNQLNHCVDEDPFLQELLQHHKHLAQRSHDLPLAFDGHMGDLQALRERLALEHMIKGGSHSIDLQANQFLSDQHHPNCTDNFERMPPFPDHLDVFARVAMEQQQEVTRRRSQSKNRISDRHSPSSSHDQYQNSLIDLSMSQEKRQRLNFETDTPSSSSPVSTSNQADKLPQQDPLVGPSGLKVDDQHMCQVCGDVAAGFHCGAYVCEACKKFFVRCLKQDAGLKFVCPRSNQCEITKDTRTQCQSCRYQKCITLGMYKPGGANISSEICHIPCSVCAAPSSGYHFGAITCEGCKGFFRRTIKERDVLKYQCSRNGSCIITSATRNICKFCRYQKCLNAGMKADGSRIGRQPNAIKHATMMQLKQIKSNLGLDTHNLPVKNILPKEEPESDDLYGRVPNDLPSNSQTSRPMAFEPLPSQLDYRDSTISSMPQLQPIIPPHEEASPQQPLESPQLHLSPTQLLSPQMQPPPQLNCSPQEPHPSPPQTSDLHEQISPLTSFTSDSCEIFSQKLNLEPEKGLFNDHTLGYMGTLPSRPLQKVNSAPVKTALSAAPPPPPAPPRPPENKPAAVKSSSTEGDLPDLGSIIQALEKAMHELNPIRKRCDMPHLSENSDTASTWALMMEQFKHSAISTLRFSKKMPGFRQMPMSTQIGTLQACMLPIVMLQLSQDYVMATEEYNYFNLSTWERNYILEKFPPFESLLDPFQYVGVAIQELEMTSMEIAFLSAIFIMSEAKNKTYESLLVQALMEHERRKGVGMERHGLILLRLGVLVRANLAHQKAVMEIMSQPDKYSSLEIPQLFQETFFNSV